MRNIVLALALCGALLLGGASPSKADTSCSGSMTGSIDGNLVVPPGAECTLTVAAVSGDILVLKGATLTIDAYGEPSTVHGKIDAVDCASVLLGGNVSVDGTVRIVGCRGGGESGFQGPGIKIAGDFECNNNTGPCKAWLGSVDGDVKIRNNRSATGPDISLDTIGGNLQCANNRAAPTHTYGPDWVTGSLQDQCADWLGFAANGTSILPAGTPPSEGMGCEALAQIPAARFPVPNTVITSATTVSATATLPEHCQIDGIVNQRVSVTDHCTYGDSFEVRLPLPGAWNGRFMFQGGGGTEGSVPAATGTAGTLSPTIAQGYAVASQDGGHENSVMLTCGTKNTQQFYLDAMSTIDQAYQSIQVTTLVAKFLIASYYGDGPDHSYWVGCSTGGRQAMVMSQQFPQYFDGIIAGDPVYDLEAIQLSGIWGVQQISDVYKTANPPLPPLVTVPGPSPEAAQPILYPAFPVSDQSLFETALLQACDKLDGTVDGVIDDVPACEASFDPAKATYVSGGTTYPLQCVAAKDPTCLSAAQIQAIKNIHQGPRTSAGQLVLAPAGAEAEDHVTNAAQGYRYDGGFMSTVGIPARLLGSATTPVQIYNTGLTQFPYAFLAEPNPPYDPATYNINTDSGLLTPSTPIVSASTSTDIAKFVNYGHKIIWYHGASDPGPPIRGTIKYYLAMAARHGGLQEAQKFSRFYPVPNMDHCTGGATTDQFDMLTPLVDWVEKGKAPGPITASGTNFTAAVYQVGFIAGAPNNAPTSRSRPLCPYPQQARYVGGPASLPSGLADATNYQCVDPPRGESDRTGD